MRIRKDTGMGHFMIVKGRLFTKVNGKIHLTMVGGDYLTRINKCQYLKNNF
jgi:hypothetical protein